MGGGDCVPETDSPQNDSPRSMQSSKSHVLGTFRRARGQSLGVLALAMSVAVVIFAVFILPHDAPAAVHSGANRHTNSLRANTGTPGPANPTVTTTTSPVATSTMAVQTGASPTADTSQSGVSIKSRTQNNNSPISSTSTTTSSTTTTTEAPTYVAPHVATASWPGNLGDPYTSASYQITTTGGEVSASATWSGTPTLSVNVSCTGAAQTQSGSSGLYVSVDAESGSCTITLAEPAGIEDSVSYSLTTNYPSS